LESSTNSGDPYSVAFILLSHYLLHPQVILLIGGVILCVILSGVISGSEVAFFALTSTQLEECEKSEKKQLKSIYKILQKSKKLLASILISNNLVNITAVTLGVYLSWKIADNQGFSKEKTTFVIEAIITLLLVFLGEIIPKVYARQKGLAFASSTIGLMLFLNKLFSPLSSVLIGFTSLIERRVSKKGYDISVDELQEAIDITTEHDENTSSEERDILLGIANFGTISVTQVMCSRMDIVAIDLATDFHQLMDKINKCGHSRIPIYDTSLDKIKGVLYIKDLLPFIQKNESYSWQKLIRPAYFIPESKKIDDLLKSFQARRVHVAIVVDEYGGTSGLITLEDVIEEIVGEINDEFDVDNSQYTQLDDYSYVFEGKTSLNDLVKILDLKLDIFDEVKGEHESLGGLLLEINENFPNVGTKIMIDNLMFTVESVNAKRIIKAKITLPNDTK